jgi:hypothetical protein
MSDPTLISAEDIHALEQASVPFRRLAQILGLFKKKLVEEGFTEEGAETLTATFATAVLGK